MSHYVVQCPNKKGEKKQGVAPSANVDDFAIMFDSECALVVSLATRAICSSSWLIDNGAFFHMMFGDNSKFKVTDISYGACFISEGVITSSKGESCSLCSRVKECSRVEEEVDISL